MPPPNFEIPENRTVLKIAFGSTRYLPTAPRSGRDALGLHWDMAHHFWTMTAGRLPEEAKWIIWGHASLIHPETGVIFGIAGGTHFYALRVPTEVAHEACLAGARPLDEQPDVFPIYGREWIRPHFAEQEQEWAVIAYDYAGTLGRVAVDHPEV